MSRLIVKNLPNKITDKKLRELFSEKGIVTDVQLKYMPDGTFRNFAFVGFKNVEDSDAAIKHFHKSFIQSNRITVEQCANVGSVNKPKSWSKYAADSNANKKALDENEQKTVKKTKVKKSLVKKLLKKHESDPIFQEYLQLHVKDSKLWKNDVDFVAHNFDDAEKHVTVAKSESGDGSTDAEADQTDNGKVANKDISDLEYMKSLMKKNDGGKEYSNVKNQKQPKQIELFTAKIKGLPCTCRKKDVKKFLKPLSPYTIRIPQKIKGFAYVGFKREQDLNKCLLKNRGFLMGKRVLVVKYSKDSQEQNSLPKSNNPKWKSQEDALKNEENIAESGKIFLRNLPYTATEEDVREQFAKFGPMAEVHIPIDRSTRQNKGIGTVTFVMPENAVKAYCELDGSVFQGRMLHLLPAKNTDVETVDESKLTHKEKKLLKQKQEASSSHNWNTLFLHHDAVASVMANKFGSSRAKILGVTNEEKEGDGNEMTAAVRLALGETNIVNDVKNFLQESGVCLKAFDGIPEKRSKTVILVKNLPPQTTHSEIIQVFKPFGILGRVVLPPNGLTALVEFYEPYEARHAFKKLAYSRFKNLPLYLEWAPEKSFVETLKKPEHLATDDTKVEEKNNNDVQELEKSKIFNGDQSRKSSNIKLNSESENCKPPSAVEKLDPEENTTIFVKNLNFLTVDDSLRTLFEQCGPVHSATVATKINNSDPQKRLSLGYGFVQYTYANDCDVALKTLNRAILDGNCLELKRSERVLKQHSEQTRTQSKSGDNYDYAKILVRNIPFQATAQEVRQLFKTFGKIKALRLPMKLNESGHRGFAFVNFVAEADAKNAFETLSKSTHLYGRRLVLEWAEKETENIDELRKRTAERFEGPAKKHKSNKGLLTIGRNDFSNEMEEL